MGDYIQTSEERRRTLYQKNIVTVPLELQMNTAFSKAYIIEASGSNAGVRGPNLFIDESAIIAICDYINSHNVYKLLLTDEESLRYGEKAYIYDAQFDSTNIEEPQLRIICQIDGTIWEAFKITFAKKIPYNNERCNIYTNLFIPRVMNDSITSPHTQETIVLDTMERTFEER